MLTLFYLAGRNSLHETATSYLLNNYHQVDSEESGARYKEKPQLKKSKKMGMVMDFSPDKQNDDSSYSHFMESLHVLLIDRIKHGPSICEVTHRFLKSLCGGSGRCHLGSPSSE